MNFADSTLIDDWGECPFPFFDDEPQAPSAPVEQWYKVYHDGGHYVATLVSRGNRPPVEHKRDQEDIDILFDSLYFQALRAGYKRTEMVDFIRAGIVKLFPDYSDLDGYIEKKIERARLNLYKRKKRFRRKANLNRWNYFTTITFDDTKHNAETFRKTLRKCLSNLHTRRGWRYMGVFEYAPETGRLHFHAIMYIPDNEMIGTITEKKDYDTRNGRIQTTHINSFFADSFGRNDFEELNSMELQNGHTLNYLLKYIGKTGERIVYSRGIATEICLKLKPTEIITEMTDFVTKYILFDDTVKWERDILRWRNYKQMTIIDLLCNPPRQRIA